MTVKSFRMARIGTPQILAFLTILMADRLVSPQFFDVRLQDGRLFGSLVDVFNRGAPVALLSLGMVLVIATRGIDLSVGAVMAIAGAIAASVVDSHSVPVALGAALGVGLLCGLWNGFLVAVLRIQPIVRWQLIHSGHPRQNNAIRKLQRFRKRSLKDGAPCRVRSRFEDGPDFVSRISMSQRKKRFANRCRMMGKVIDHLDPVDFAAKFLATRYPCESSQCVVNHFDRQPVRQSN